MAGQGSRDKRHVVGMMFILSSCFLKRMYEATATQWLFTDVDKRTEVITACVPFAV